MTEVFKCGDIASIINDNKSETKSKKRSKLSKKFKEIFDENRNKVIEIKKHKELKIKVIPEHDQDDDEEELHEEQEFSQSQDPKRRQLSDEELKEKNGRTAFVGNLPNNITTKRLKQMFNKLGQIESIRLRGGVPQKLNLSKKVAVITKRFHSGKDNINAYIVFKSKDDIKKALELNGTEVDGHHIRVDGNVSDNTHDNSRSVFVGNLPFIVKEEELFEFFKDCGDIDSVRVVRDSTTGVGKGFGFILFKSKDSVVLALEKNERQLLGRELRVSRAKGKRNETQPKPEKIKIKKERHRNRTVQDNTISDETETVEKKTNKKFKKSYSKPEFEGISAKKIKKKTNKKKEIQSSKTKKKQKKLAQIFSH